MKKPVLLVVAAAGLAVLIVLGSGKAPMQQGTFSEAIAADNTGANTGMAVATFADPRFVQAIDQVGSRTKLRTKVLVIVDATTERQGRGIRQLPLILREQRKEPDLIFATGDGAIRVIKVRADAGKLTAAEAGLEAGAKLGE